MPHSLLELMAFSRESDASFEASELEYEVEVYLKGVDIDAMASKSSYKERQEQWGIYVPKTSENAASGSVRVRRTEVVDQPDKYVLTVKTDAGEAGKLESPTVVEEGHFEQFKLMADQGLIKVRYHIPHETQAGVSFMLEVDVFRNAQGEIVPWVKIDAELPEGTVLTAADIPLEHDEIILVTPGEKKSNPELAKKIEDLYKTYFTAKNTHVEQGTGEQALEDLVEESTNVTESA